MAQFNQEFFLKEEEHIEVKIEELPVKMEYDYFVNSASTTSSVVMPEYTFE